jgi:hypothetical protein
MSRASDRTRASITILSIGLAALAMAGCTASAAAPKSATDRTTPRGSPSAGPGKVNPAREATNPDPNFDYGFTILVTNNGFEPHWLVSECCRTITWKNMTLGPVIVRFDHQLVRSEQIPPGGTFTWLPKNIQSVSYHDEDDPAHAGLIQVNQSFES